MAVIRSRPEKAPASDSSSVPAKDAGSAIAPNMWALLPWFALIASPICGYVITGSARVAGAIVVALVFFTIAGGWQIVARVAPRLPSRSPEVDESGTARCSSCDPPTLADARFCPNCGNAVVRNQFRGEGDNSAPNRTATKPTLESPVRVSESISANEVQARPAVEQASRSPEPRAANRIARTERTEKQQATQRILTKTKVKGAALIALTIGTMYVTALCDGTISVTTPQERVSGLATRTAQIQQACSTGTALDRSYCYRP